MTEKVLQLAAARARTPLPAPSLTTAAAARSAETPRAAPWQFPPSCDADVSINRRCGERARNLVKLRSCPALRRCARHQKIARAVLPQHQARARQSAQQRDLDGSRP